MKNKLFYIFLVFFFLIYSKATISNELDIKSKNINILENGTLIEAFGEVEVISSDGLIIKGDTSKYNKKDNLLVINGNVEVINEEQSIIIKSNSVTYEKNKELIYSKGETKAQLKDGYVLSTRDLFFNRKKLIIFSDEKTTLENKETYFEFEKFKSNLSKDLVNVENLLLIDKDKNKFLLKKAKINTSNMEIIGDNAELFFKKSFFGNSENDPRLIGEKLSNNDKETKVIKGSFTTCKFRDDDKCPPWLLRADEINHDKERKIIEYKNAWLNLYDMPVLYFPYFHHPDPTVERQSGFLLPKFNNSNVLGTSVQLPYFKVISDNKDYTISPRLFLNDKLLLQSEFRQANQNSDFIFDNSLLRTNEETTSHFFSNYFKTIGNDFFEINIESVSNRNYLKKYDISSPLINNKSYLNSFISLEKNFSDSFFFSSVEVFEDLTKESHDSYEYIYPNYIFNKDIYTKFGMLELNSKGHQSKYETNKFDGLIVNDINFISNLNFTSKNLLNNYSLILKNVNSRGENSNNFKEGTDNKLLAEYIFNSSLPLFKKGKNYSSYFTPKLSFRFSPTETRNITTDDLRVDYANLFSSNRISLDDTLEGGESITLGSEYSLTNKQNEERLNFSIGQIFRKNENEDLPKVSSIGDKRSDLIGDLKFTPNEIINFNYSFSADKNMENLNYNLIETEISYNNFLTSFNYLKSENIFGEKSHISNSTKFKFNNKNSISFGTSKNLDKNLTEYYDLVYEYENDCLIAAVEYKKNYYSDIDLEPDENIFFSIKIVPFGQINTPNVK